VDRVLRLVDVPAAVGVEADAALRSEILAHRGNPGHIVGELLPGLCDLDLHSAAAGKAIEDFVHGIRSHGGEGGVHPDLAAEQRGSRPPTEIDGRGQPRGCFGVVVFEERGEFGPPGRSLEEHHLATLDGAEPLAQRQRDDACGSEHVWQRWQHDSSLS